MPQGLYLSQKMALAQVLAPQLQQSLALLQAPTLELQALVQQEMEQNPVLEEVPDAEVQTDKPERDSDGEGDSTTPSLQNSSADPAEPPADTQYDPTKDGESRDPVDEFQAEFEKLQQLDQDWRDHFAATNVPLRTSQEDEEKREFMFNSLATQQSLQEYLMEQVRMSELNNGQVAIAELLVGNIDDYGYLKTSVDELCLSTNIDPDKIENVLNVIQSFHPAGVGARDLRECLLLQLERKKQKHTLEYRIIDKCFDALSKRRIPEIARVLDRDVDDIQDSIKRIALLDPRPGREFLPDNDMYVVPEVFVSRQGDDFIVTTNNDHLPHLRISNHYKDLLSKAEQSSEVRNYIREKIRAGKFLIKSLHQRQSTLLNIGKEIVHRQREFMEKGTAFLKPLTMVQVAEVVGVHETTVSRAVAGKYMQTPQGLFEMKYFFTSGLQTAAGESMANTSVKEMIDEIFKNEDQTKPLSDQEVVKMLQDKGIVIARRTVAKYRGELNILPSNLRRVY